MDELVSTLGIIGMWAGITWFYYECLVIKSERP